ncbi:hypothetical protein V8E36_000330 [Tilletia maclaganii]
MAEEEKGRCCPILRTWAGFAWLRCATMGCRCSGYTAVVHARGVNQMQYAVLVHAQDYSPSCTCNVDSSILPLEAGGQLRIRRRSPAHHEPRARKSANLTHSDNHHEHRRREAWSGVRAPALAGCHPAGRGWKAPCRSLVIALLWADLEPAVVGGVWSNMADGQTRHECCISDWHHPPRSVLSTVSPHSERHRMMPWRVRVM